MQNRLRILQLSPKSCFNKIAGEPVFVANSYIFIKKLHFTLLISPFLY